MAVFRPGGRYFLLPFNRRFAMYQPFLEEYQRQHAYRDRSIGYVK